MPPEIKPFHLSIPETQLTDLRERLARTRWPEPETVSDNSQGPRLAKLQALCEYWQKSYDWRRCEAMLNDFGQYQTSIDGLGIYFLHVRSPEPDALPLLLAHGWPGSVLEFRKVIGPLTNPASHGGDPRQAFHLVIPSMPGFGFSDKPSEAGWNLSRIADAWITLMDRLGYQHWVAQGGDFGAAILEAIGRQAPPSCLGLLFNMALIQPTPEEAAAATPEEKAMMESAAHYWDELSGYSKEQETRPQTIGYALADSPVGQAAWIYAMFQDVSQSGGNAESVFSFDEMLDDIMLYWLPNAGASSARLYWEMKRAMRSGPPPASPVSVPVGFSIFPGEIIRTSRRWAEQRYSKIIHFHELDKGGHFAALEQPERFINEVRDCFSSIR